MKSLSFILTSIVTLLLFQCHSTSALEIAVRDDQPIYLYSQETPNLNAFGNISDDGTSDHTASFKRSLLSFRQICQAGYSYCSNSGFCCPSDTGCCSDGNCIRSGEMCCSFGGKCASGWKCCVNSCVPQDAICCSNGNYCDAGMICVVTSSGLRGCCMDINCKAPGDYLGGGSLNGSGSETVDSLPLETATSLSTDFTYVVAYTYYTYWYAEGSTHVQKTSTLELKSAPTVVHTTVSIKALNSVEALSSLSEIKYSLSVHSPAQTATPTSGATMQTSSGSISLAVLSGSATAAASKSAAASRLDSSRGVGGIRIAAMVLGAMAIPGAIVLRL